MKMRQLNRTWQQSTYGKVLDGHLARPETAEFIQVLACHSLLDVTTDGVVSTTHPALDFEFNVCLQTSLRASNNSVVAKLVLHLSKQYASCIHIWLSDETGHYG